MTQPTNDNNPNPKEPPKGLQAFFFIFVAGVIAIITVYGVKWLYPDPQETIETLLYLVIFLMVLPKLPR